MKDSWDCNLGSLVNTPVTLDCTKAKSVNKDLRD